MTRDSETRLLTAIPMTGSCMTAGRDDCTEVDKGSDIIHKEFKAVAGYIKPINSTRLFKVFF